MKKLPWHYLLLFLLGTAVFWEGCQNDDDLDPASPPVSNAETNTWILDSMRAYYYWNHTIPENPNLDLEPPRFFYSILNGEYTPNGEYISGDDRFSWIQDAQELSDNLAGQSKSFGYEFLFYFVAENSNKVVARVIYPYLDSEAEEKGLKRGDAIGKINGEELYYNSPSDNNLGIIYDTGSPQTLSVGVVDQDDEFQEQETLTISPVTIQEDPVYYHHVYSENGKNIGYLVYNGFIPSPANNPGGSQYDDRIDEIFGDFKSQQVSELVLDLRYNLGGSIGSAVSLASLIAPSSVTQADVFARYEWNPDIQTWIEGSEERIEGQKVRFRNKPERLGNLNRVYVLVSGRTASASELIINGLSPYMDVILIGDGNTVGKNVGSVTIEDEEGDIPWGLQPIVIKIYNSQDESDYANGFSPEETYKVDENFREFGDRDESFLSRAIQDITGEMPDIALSARGLSRGGQQPAGRQIGSSLDHKRGAGEMYISPDQLPFE